MTALLLIGEKLVGLGERIQSKFPCRTTVALDTSQGVAWLALRKFDALVCSSALTESELQRLVQRAKDQPRLKEVFIVGETNPLVHHHNLEFLEVSWCTGEDWESHLIQELRSLVAQRLRGTLDCEVVVVDDLDAPREIICSYVEALGVAQVHGCRSSSEALAYLATPGERPRIVLTDVKMPHIDGCELIRQVRLHRDMRRLPIIALTAYGTMDCLVDALSAGASGFLVKPPKRKQLARELARACRIIDGTRSPRLATIEEAERLRLVSSD